jgi:uncharacterized membrane protein
MIRRSRLAGIAVQPRTLCRQPMHRNRRYVSLAPQSAQQSMVPFYVLLVGFAAFRVAGYAGIGYLNHWQTSMRAAVGLMFLFTASAHWGSRRADLIRMVPPALKAPGLLVTITGILVIAGAIGLNLPQTARIAAMCLALLMLALFPANVRAARQAIELGGRPPTPLPLRTALQVIFILATLAAGLC